MIAILLSLSSSVLWGASDFGGGVLARRLPAYAVVGATQTCGLLALTAVILGRGVWVAPGAWAPWAIAAGLSGAIGLVCFYMALASGTMGIVSPIAALGAIVPVAVGILRGERPTPLVLVGIAVALVGAALASGPELKGGASPRSVVLAVIAGALFGSAFTFMHRGGASDVLFTLWGMRISSVTMFAIVALALRTTGGLVRRDLLPIVLVGLGDVAANLAFTYASQLGYLSITAVLASLYPVVTVALAAGFLHERMARVQQVGVVAALAGVVLVSVG